MSEYVWKLDVEYPEGALFPEDFKHSFYAGRPRADWKPEGWEPDDEYLERFQTTRFIWPSVRRVYLSRTAAVDRALLLEHYGAKVRLLRSKPLEFEERSFRRPLRVIQGGAA
ncbi:hypothetical protein [Rhodococcus sp. Chr-9]|uniref:hypothetical protein n=1 Tax=Rhodococcus sp. Chr-9 TaxID=713612 RepID=UPI000573D75A|nr:hypothetical protein [Rhodococcus sp. Chr-9]KHJ74669.1 hypothetical protein QR64_00345 [Rhodococcus sp. Chr-9]